MNIFVLDQDQRKAVACLHDKHVVCMTKETAQILSTVRQQLGDLLPGLPNKTHSKHPCVIWAGSSKENYLWLVFYFKCICEEYTYRYFKLHSYHDLLLRFSDTRGFIFPENGLSDFALAMPDQYKVEDAVQSYRNYYLGEKIQGKVWTNRTLSELPEWLSGSLTIDQFKVNIPKGVKS